MRYAQHVKETNPARAEVILDWQMVEILSLLILNMLVLTITDKAKTKSPIILAH
jgi:hypothetical protein